MAGQGREGVRLLGECLSFGLRQDEVTALRLRLLGERGGWDRLIALAAEAGLAAALSERLDAHGLAPRFGASGGASPADVLAALSRTHHLRRAKLKQHLDAIVAALNGIGVEPTLLKGARSLWTGSPGWRHLQDIDLLVPPDRASASAAALAAIGFHKHPDLRERPRRHHLDPLFRGDLPGWIEIHRRAGNAYCERLLPTHDVQAATTVQGEPGRRAGLLSMPMHVLHAVVHHHVGHSAFARGTLSVKGLYEFAWDTAAMSEAEREELAALAHRHPRLAAMLDLWIAASADLFRMPVGAPFHIADDARARSERMLRRRDAPSRWKYPGYGEEIGMACALGRIAAAGGGTLIRRQTLRAGVVLSLLPRLPF